MIRAVIIDDEPNNIEVLQALLQAFYNQVTIVATATNAAYGAAIIQQYNPDLVFLDIQMPDRNGFDMLRSLSKYDFEIVFVTAYDQYGIQAIKFSAIDYLLKPVQAEELRVAVDKVMEKLKTKQANLQVSNLIDYVRTQQNKEEHSLALATVKEIKFVKTDQIIRCESENAYTVFHLANGQKLTISRPIYEYEELLDDYGFIRCHQSHLVNKKYIRSWVKEEGGFLLLENGEQIPVSRGKKEIVANKLINIK
jgi:two-component system LytT family response regulator